MVLMKNDLILLGYIAKAVGLKGALRIKLLNVDSEALSVGLCLTLRHGKMPEKELHISALESDRFYLEGINYRSAAEALQGSEVFINRSDLPKLSPDEVYLNDLIGAEVKLGSGEIVGHVSAFASNNAQILLEITGTDGHSFSIPLVPAIVIAIDEEHKIITIDPPAGLLDLD